MTETPLTTSARELLGWVWRIYLRRRMPLLAIALVLMAFEGGMLGVLSWLIMPMFDRIFIAGDTNAIPWIAGAIALVFVTRALAGIIQQIIMARLGEKVVAELQSDLLAHLMRLDPVFFRTHPPGTLIERVRGDTAALMQLFVGVIAAFGRDLVSLLSLFAVALMIDWVWTLVAVVGVPLLFGPIVLLQRIVRRTSREARAQAATAATRLDEIFHGISTIQLAGTESREADRFRRTVAGYVKAQVRAAASAAGIPALIDVVAALGFAGVLAYGGLQIIAGEKSVGEFMAFFTAMALVFEPLRRLGAVSGRLQAALAGLERSRALMDAPIRISSPSVPASALADGRPARIAFEGVCFRHEAVPVLDNLSFVAEPGQTTALVGPSGAGKTTVLTMIARFADPQEGQVLLGGQDLRSFALPDLRAQLSVVSQETALFDETIRDNVTMGRDVSEAELAAALEAAHVSDFLPQLASGLDSPAGPRGSNLSGGQRQRVAIARALLRDTPVLLLDEATSALDAASEARVQEALDRLAQGRTTIVIAHRLSTIRQADKIIVLDRGQKVDEGRHDDLLARGGLYANLCRLQFGGT